MADLERWLVELRAAEAVLAGERMHPAASRRLARRLAAGERERRSWRPYLPAACFAAGALLVLLVLAVNPRRWHAEPTPRASQSELQSSAPSCADTSAAAGSRDGAPSCAPSPAPAQLPAHESTTSDDPSEGLVPPRDPPRAAPPPRRPGSTRMPVQLPEPSTTIPSPPTEEDRIGALLRELRALRRAGRYAEAARRLEEALGETWPARTREVLHYELGTIVDGHLDASERACAHWREHLERFPGTRYRRAVRDAQRRRGCALDDAPR